jgi:hypothetical protein
MSLKVAKNAGKLSTKQLLASQDRLCSMDLVNYVTNFRGGGGRRGICISDCLHISCCVLRFRKRIITIYIPRKYFPGDQGKKNEIGMAWPACGEEKCMWDLVGKPYGQRLPGIPRIRWETNFKMCLK